MGRYSFGRGWGRAPTPQEVRDLAKADARRARRRAAGLDDRGKTRLLARGIKLAAIRSSTVTLDDLTQTGVSKHDAERLYEPAMKLALRCDPAIAGVAT